MYIIDQETANEIARTVKMKYPEMKRIFEMTEEDADQWEMKFRAEIEEKADYEVARAVSTYLPLYLENWAITLYIRKKKNQGLRNMMPEILSPKEMALWAKKDLMYLAPEQITQIIDVTSEYEKRFIVKVGMKKADPTPESEMPRPTSLRTFMGMMDAIKEVREQERLIDSQAGENSDTD